jgi:hypothetical protein
MADDDDDFGFDDNFAAIGNITSKPEPTPDTRKAFVDTRTEDEIRASPGYKWLAAQFEAGAAARAAELKPKTVEQKWYGKR